MHILLFLPAATCKSFTDLDYINVNICAEISLLEDNPIRVLIAIVQKFILHRPYREYNSTAPYIVTQPSSCFLVCLKKFPKQYYPAIVIHKDGYLEYQRRNNGYTLNVKCCDYTMRLNNYQVVLYNLQFLCKYSAYINVKVCGTIHAIKYVYKYIYKGTNQAVLNVSN